MARSTQFIGLNDTSENLVKKAKLLGIYKYCKGMFDDEYPLHYYAYDDLLLYETVQDVPWSSGPMIFCALGILFKAEVVDYKVEDFEFEDNLNLIENILNNMNQDNHNLVLQWTKNPDLEYEVDSEKGQYWV